MCFSVGATTILWPGPPTPPDIYSVIEDHRPTLFFSVPTNYAMLLSHKPDGDTDFDLTSVRQAVSAGEALPPTLFDRFKERFRVEILDAIGSTEALHTFISNRPGDMRGLERANHARLRGRIVDEEQRPVCRRGRQPVNQRRFRLRVLLEPAREDERDHRGPLDQHRRQISADGDGYFGTRAAMTT